MIELGKAMIDWLTITSREKESWKWFTGRLMEGADGAEERWTVVRRMQYVGYERPADVGGGFFAGSDNTGTGGNMFMAWGAAAEHLASLLREWHELGCQYNVTRIDIQRSELVDYDKESQWRLFNRLKKDAQKPDYLDDKGKMPMATVYVGSRRSAIFTRIYQKPIDQKEGLEGKVVLRYEVEYKHKAAPVVMRGLLGTDTRQAYINSEVAKRRDEYLTRIFTHGGDYAGVRIERVKERSKTEKWLLEQVLPAFARHIADHDDGGAVATAFQHAISAARGFPGNEVADNLGE